MREDDEVFSNNLSYVNVQLIDLIESDLNCQLKFGKIRDSYISIIMEFYGYLSDLNLIIGNRKA